MHKLRIFRRGAEQGFIRDTPCRNVILPKRKKSRKNKALEEDKLKRFMEYLESKPWDEDFKRIIKVLLYTGMRSGECLGLAWEDIDFENNTNMGFNLGTTNNTGKLNMNDFLGAETAQNTEKEIPISQLVPWENQPFKMYSDFKMNELVESIRENGLLSRIIVSPIAGGKYRILAGHNRVEACRRAGFTTVPSIVKDVDENRAKLIMADTNLCQRTELLPSERAFAYKAQQEALIALGSPRSTAAIAEKYGEARSTIQRYIACSRLVPEMLKLLDNGRIGLLPAVSISGMPMESQRAIAAYLNHNYRWQILEKKQQIISQIMSGKPAARTCEDIDDTALTFAEMKAATTGNPLIAEKMTVDNEVSRLKLLQASYYSQQRTFEEDVQTRYPEKIRQKETQIENVKRDIELINAAPPVGSEDNFHMTLNGRTYTERNKAGTELATIVTRYMMSEQYQEFEPKEIGSLNDFRIIIRHQGISVSLALKANAHYTCDYQMSGLGGVIRLCNLYERIPDQFTGLSNELEQAKRQLANAQAQLGKPFQHEDELRDLLERQSQINAELEVAENRHDEVVIGYSEDDEEEMEM